MASLYLVPSLKYIAYFNAAHRPQGSRADGAWMSIAGCYYVLDEIRFVISAAVDILEVPAFTIGAGNEVGAAEDQIVDHQQHVFRLDSDRRAISRLGPYRPDFIRLRGTQLARLEGVRQFCFIQLHVAAHDDENKLLLFLSILLNCCHEKQCLGGPTLGDSEKVRERSNRIDAGRGDLRHWQRIRTCIGAVFRLRESCDLSIGLVAAPRHRSTEYLRQLRSEP